MEKKFNKNAVISFVLSLVGLFIFGIILGIIATVMGNKVMHEINQETEKGYGLAKASLIIGIVDIIGGIVGLIMLL